MITAARLAGRLRLLPIRSSIAARSFSASTIIRSNDEELLQRIKGDLKTAMKSKDSFTSTVLRSILSEHQYAAKEQKKAELSSILQRAVSRRKESAAQFRAAKPPREDLASKEDDESKVISRFLPERMSEDDLRKMIGDTVEEIKASGEAEGKKLLGAVIKAVSGKVDKASAPGAWVSEVVRDVLKT